VAHLSWWYTGLIIMTSFPGLPLVNAGISARRGPQARSTAGGDIPNIAQTAPLLMRAFVVIPNKGIEVVDRIAAGIGNCSSEISRGNSRRKLFTLTHNSCSAAAWTIPSNC
jgi:hypothetical protein